MGDSPCFCRLYDQFLANRPNSPNLCFYKPLKVTLEYSWDELNS